MSTVPTPESTQAIPADNDTGPVATTASWRGALRRQCLERRRALSPDACAEFSATIRERLRRDYPQLAEMRVGFCWPMDNEPDLRPLIEDWIREGKNGFAALLPVVVKPKAPLAFRAWAPGTPLQADRYGIPTPSGGDFVLPEALLIPVVAFDAAGYRLGYGGGFFDRTLASLRPRPFAIGIGFELSRVDSIRPGPHDERLDAMVTESHAD